jgi:hypothetical protein
VRWAKTGFLILIFTKYVQFFTLLALMHFYSCFLYKILYYLAWMGCCDLAIINDLSILHEDTKEIQSQKYSSFQYFFFTALQWVYYFCVANKNILSVLYCNHPLKKCPSSCSINYYRQQFGVNSLYRINLQNETNKTSQWDDKSTTNYINNQVIMTRDLRKK